MVNWIKKNKILLKLEDNQKPAFLNAWKQYERCLEMSQKGSDGDKRSFSEVYFGIAYEFFILDLVKEGIEVAKKIHPSRYVQFIQNLDDDIHLVVFTVVYSHIKYEEFFNENFFFQSMEGQLEVMNLSFPKNERVYFPAFIKAWEKVFGPLRVERSISIDPKTGEAILSEKISK